MSAEVFLAFVDSVDESDFKVAWSEPLEQVSLTSTSHVHYVIVVKTVELDRGLALG